MAKFTNLNSGDMGKDMFFITINPSNPVTKLNGLALNRVLAISMLEVILARAICSSH